jgi:hypothetical protein
MELALSGQPPLIFTNSILRYPLIVISLRHTVAIGTSHVNTFSPGTP